MRTSPATTTRASKDELSRFLAGLAPGQIRIVRRLRRVVRRAAPRARESVLWGGLSYHRPEVGGRVKGAVCMIVAKDGRVRLDFIHGARLADPARLLRGAMKSKRFVSIESVADAERPEVEDLVRRAASVLWPRSTDSTERSP
jgi:hypothetical protein